MKRYKEIIIKTTPQNSDIISGLLWQLDISGITENDNSLTVFIESSKKSGKQEIETILSEAVNNEIINSYELFEEEFEDKNWNEEYEQNVKVIEITNKIVIKPSFKEYTRKEGQIIITIDPKMSFGTGEHQTTKLVLIFLEKYLNKNDVVLDIGSGTGILAIASVYLGAKKALGIDNDEWCLLNGIENVKMNNLDNKVEIRLEEISQTPENDFDLIVANINKHILLEIGEKIRSKIKKTGKLILSGLLISDKKDILDLYTKLGFKIIDQSEMGEWISLVFTV